MVVNRSRKARAADASAVWIASSTTSPTSVAGAPATPQEVQAFVGRVIALKEAMDRAGAFAFGGALHDPEATTVVRGGTGLDKVATDGPFVEAKEHIGGFYIVNAEDLDEALKWAEKVVEANNHDIEVRPF